VGVARCETDTRRSIWGIDPMATTGRGWLWPAPYPLRESKGFHIKSQTVRFFGTKSYLCGFVPVQKSPLEPSLGRGTQPGSSREGRRRSGQAVILREASRFGLACASGSSRV
jgi:hypothetical protein